MELRILVSQKQGGKQTSVSGKNWERAFFSIDYGYFIISQLTEDGKVILSPFFRIFKTFVKLRILNYLTEASDSEKSLEYTLLWKR